MGSGGVKKGQGGPQKGSGGDQKGGTEKEVRRCQKRGRGGSERVGGGPKKDQGVPTKGQSVPTLGAYTEGSGVPKKGSGGDKNGSGGTKMGSGWSGRIRIQWDGSGMPGSGVRGCPKRGRGCRHWGQGVPRPGGCPPRCHGVPQNWSGGAQLPSWPPPRHSLSVPRLTPCSSTRCLCDSWLMVLAASRNDWGEGTAATPGSGAGPRRPPRVTSRRWQRRPAHLQAVSVAAVHDLEHHRGLPGSLVAVLLPPDPAVDAGEGALGQALTLGGHGVIAGGPLCATPPGAPLSQGDFMMFVPPILCSVGAGC